LPKKIASHNAAERALRGFATDSFCTFFSNV
jgi:hypothetical protein